MMDPIGPLKRTMVQEDEERERKRAKVSNAADEIPFLPSSRLEEEPHGTTQSPILKISDLPLPPPDNPLNPQSPIEEAPTKRRELTEIASGGTAVLKLEPPSNTYQSSNGATTLELEPPTNVPQIGGDAVGIKVEQPTTSSKQKAGLELEPPIEAPQRSLELSPPLKPTLLATRTAPIDPSQVPEKAPITAQDKNSSDVITGITKPVITGTTKPAINGTSNAVIIGVTKPLEPVVDEMGTTQQEENQTTKSTDIKSAEQPDESTTLKTSPQMTAPKPLAEEQYNAIMVLERERVMNNTRSFLNEIFEANKESQTSFIATYIEKQLQKGITKLWDRMNAAATVCISGVASSATEEMIEELFNKCGDVNSVLLTKSEGSGLVQFMTTAGANAAIKEGSVMFESSRIYIKKQVIKSPGDGEAMNKVRISGVPYSATEEITQQLFCKFGVVHKVILKKNSDGSCEGSGFVYFKTAESATTAVKENAVFLRGATIKIDSTSPLKETGGGRTKVTLSGVAYSATDDMIKELFSQFGTVKSVHLVRKADGSCTGSGTVHFKTAKGALAAGKRDSLLFRGSTISILCAGTNDGADPKKVRITGVAYSATDEMVKDLFSQFGTVASLVLKKNADQSCEGSGIVGFSTEACAAAAVKQSSLPFRGGEISICDMWGRSVVKLDGDPQKGMPNALEQVTEKAQRQIDPATGIELCVEFQNGNCWRGSSCIYSHGAASPTSGKSGKGSRGRGRGFGGIGLPRGTCFAFQQGNCSRGRGCRYLHLDGEGSSGGYGGGFGGRGSGYGDGFGGSAYGGGYSRGGFGRGYQGGYGGGFSGRGRGRGRGLGFGGGNTADGRGTCYAFQKGLCTRGGTCRFRHEGGRGGGGEGATGRIGACFDFQKGLCNRGDSCRYRHEGGNPNASGYDPKRSPLTAPSNANEGNTEPAYSGTTADGKTKGNVKKWFPEKGFGMIAADGKDIFVHRSEVKSESTWVSLKIGEPVEFNVIKGTDGRRKAEGVTGPDGGFVQGSVNAQVQKPCFNFQKFGNCKFNERCIFKHIGGPPVLQNQGVVNSPAPGNPGITKVDSTAPTIIAPPPPPPVSSGYPKPPVYSVATSYPPASYPLASYPATYPASYPPTTSYPAVSASYSYPAAYSYAMPQPVTYAAAGQTAAYAYPIAYGTTGATYLQPTYRTTAATYFQPTQAYTTLAQQTTPQVTKSEETPTTNEQTSPPAIVADPQQMTWM